MARTAGCPSTWSPRRSWSLDALPLTPNGKVDRKALPDPAHARLADGGDFVPPRGPIEEALAEAWAELLGVERVGAHDNFFELGGHSLLAIQLLGRLRDLFDVEVPLRDLFEEPTLARLARLVERALADRDGPQAPPIEPGGPRRPAAGLLRPAAALVPRPARARQRRLQHPHRRPPRRPLDVDALRRRSRRDRPPPRGPADHLRRRRRRPASGHRRLARAASARRGPRRPPRGRRPQRALERVLAGGRSALRPRARAARPRRPDPAWRATSTSSW